MNISGSTTMLGLIGSPVGHSKSPEMYNYCFKKYGCDCAYLAFDVTEREVEKAVNAVRTFQMRGANVTMPLKNAVLPYLDPGCADHQIRKHYRQRRRCSDGALYGRERIYSESRFRRIRSKR
mgnify:CR=1 FL=1